jgi:SAM-dependent methyltransferase
VNRSRENVRRHYEIEKELASRLMHATKDERRQLYGTLYNELFANVPDHPQLWNIDDREHQRKTEHVARFLSKFLSSSDVYLEIGAGDCLLVRECAKFVRRAIAVDVSETMLLKTPLPPNCDKRLSDGCDIPIPSNTATFAFSDQLMEHLHPDDAVDQLKSIYRALVPGGRYLCATPHRFSGPHDVSKHFDRVATGFHLKEYSIKELAALFRDAGFRETRLVAFVKGRSAIVAVRPLLLVERVLERLPYEWRRGVAESRLFRPFFQRLMVLGVK